MAIGWKAPLRPSLQESIANAFHAQPLIDWSQSASAIANLVTFLSSEARSDSHDLHTPLACARINGMPVRIYDATSGGVSSAYPAGTIIRCDDQVWIQTGTGQLCVHQVLDARGMIRDAHDYFQELGLAAGQRFELIRGWEQTQSETLAA